ncbi:hypothetical protein GCWU000246_00457 [Jonquetella anthropi E3_33 E1]|nr:hypothetical protein GCWU000246_00457 [Jonquetella anthropi E3_33 E1]
MNPSAPWLGKNAERRRRRFQQAFTGLFLSWDCTCPLVTGNRGQAAVRASVKGGPMKSKRKSL